MEKPLRVYYQECDGRLLNVYYYNDNNDEIDLRVGDKINDPAENHIEGNPHTTMRRVQ